MMFILSYFNLEQSHNSSVLSLPRSLSLSPSFLLSRTQFHQHFMRAFFCTKVNFSSYVWLCNFLAPKFCTCKTLMKLTACLFIMQFVYLSSTFLLSYTLFQFQSPSEYNSLYYLFYLILFFRTFEK
jgi:hypothetical protein